MGKSNDAYNSGEEKVTPKKEKPNLRESKSHADLIFKKEGIHKTKPTVKQTKARKAAKAAGKARKNSR